MCSQWVLKKLLKQGMKIFLKFLQIAASFIP
jgi:hypothetical protein